MDALAAVDIGGTLAKISFVIPQKDIDKYPHLEIMTIKLEN